MKNLLLLLLTFCGMSLYAQKVGINTNTPLTNLHVIGTDSALILAENTDGLQQGVSSGVFLKTGARFTGAVRTTGESNLEARLGLFTYAVSAASGLKERLSILDNGKVGINTITPGAQLAVRSTVSSVLDLENSTDLMAGAQAALHFKIGGKFAGSIKATGNTTMQARLGFFTGTHETTQYQSEIMSVTDNGRVGVGVTEPGATLHVKSDPFLAAYPHVMIEDDGDGTARLQFKNNTPAGAWDVIGYNTNTAAGSYLHIDNIFNNSRTTVMHIQGNGSVGMGVATAEGRLHIQSNSSTGFPQLKLEETESEYARIKMANSSASYWDIAGKGSATASAAFLNLFYHNGTTGGDKFSLAGTGNLTIAGTLTQNSDARLKTNISTLENSMEKLEQIHGYHYNWRDADRDPLLQTGLMAQEVEKVMPELVITNEAGVKSLNYSGLVPYLLEAIKELKKEVEQLKASK